jgi:hypothetical protein
MLPRDKSYVLYVLFAHSLGWRGWLESFSGRWFWLLSAWAQTGKSVPNLFEGHWRLFLEQEVLFLYLCFPKGDKHGLRFYSKAAASYLGLWTICIP